MHIATGEAQTARRPAVVLVADAGDATGLTGLAAALRTLAALALRGAPVTTAVGHTLDDGGWHGAPLPEAALRRQVEGARDVLPIDATRVGFAGSEAGVRALGELVAGAGPLVVDPAFVDRAGRTRMTAEASAALAAYLFPLAAVVTPNAHEAERLTGHAVSSVSSMRDVCRRLADRGARAVLITGGRLDGHAVDLLYDGGGFQELGRDRRPAGHLLRGVGDLFSTALTAGLALGRPLPEAADAAKSMVTAALDAATSPAPRHRAAEPLWQAFEALGLESRPIEIQEKTEGGTP